MKARLTLLLLLLSSVTMAATPSTGRDEAQIRDALKSMHDAADASNAERFMQWYSHSPTLIVTFDGQSVRGWQANLDQQRQWWSGKKSDVTYSDERPPEIAIQSEGLATTVQWMSVGSPHSPKPPMRLVVSSVWKRMPEGWRIVLAHESSVH